MQQAMTPPQDMRHKTLKQCLDDAKRNERHNTNAETRYWCDQYKQIATEALATEQRPQNCGTQQAAEPVVGWVLLREDADGFEPIMFYGGKEKPEGEFKDRFTLRPIRFADATQQPLTAERVIECAARLVAHADFQLGGVLGAHSKPKEIPSSAVSKVKARHLAALRDALAAHGIAAPATIPAPQLEAAQALIDHQAEKTWTDPHAADAKIWRQKGGAQ